MHKQKKKQIRIRKTARISLEHHRKKNVKISFPGEEKNPQKSDQIKKTLHEVGGSVSKCEKKFIIFQIGEQVHVNSAGLNAEY